MKEEELVHLYLARSVFEAKRVSDKLFFYDYRLVVSRRSRHLKKFGRLISVSMNPIYCGVKEMIYLFACGRWLHLFSDFFSFFEWLFLTKERKKKKVKKEEKMKKEKRKKEEIKRKLVRKKNEGSKERKNE